MKYMIINGDALNLPIADKTVQCVVTCPPYYGLRDYGVDGQMGLRAISRGIRWEDGGGISRSEAGIER